jgi:hypothetical protein
MKQTGHTTRTCLRHMSNSCAAGEGGRSNESEDILHGEGLGNFEIPGDHGAFASRGRTIPRKIPDAGELMVHYAINPMYHADPSARML